MSKVLVDREDLEAVCNFLAHGGQAVAVLRWAESILAQPAEAEGVEVEVVGLIDEADEGCFVELMHDRTFRLGEKLVRQTDHLAALSAVTAERDRLLAELERAYANYNQVSYASTERGKQIDQLRDEVEALRVALLGITSVNPAERGIEWAKAHASDGLKGAGSELYARWLDTFKEAEALRKDAERYRMFRRGMFDPDRFDADIDAAIEAAGVTVRG